MKKKKILFHSDLSSLNTGFARNAKEVLMHLWKTGKYEIVEYCCGVLNNSPVLEEAPWKRYGTNPVESYHLQAINSPALQQKTRYGAYFIDDIVATEKPDIYIGVNDYWGFDGYTEKPWWNKFPCVLWITADSLPLLPNAVQNADKVKNLWMWADFARKEYHRLGYTHVKTVYGALDTKTFFPLQKEDKKLLKAKSGLLGHHVFGFVFRNQLRKLVGSLLEGFKLYKQDPNNPPAKVLLHTNWMEGWSIPNFIKEFGLDNNDIVTTFICRSCREFHIAPFTGQPKPCPHCGTKEGCITTNVTEGPTEKQLNLVYNLMDSYIHPMTSGGLEMPIVEAMMTGLPTATVDYSCGQDYCASGLVEKIDYSTYREINTNFVKASTDPASIAGIMKKFATLPAEDYEILSHKTRLWAAKKFDKFKTCKRIENFIDKLPENKFDFKFDKRKYNTDVAFDNSSLSDSQWAQKLVKDIFNVEEDIHGDTVRSVVKSIGEKGREEVWRIAINNATAHNKNLENSYIPNLFKESPSGNLAFISPSNQLEKMFSVPILERISEGKPVIVISDPIDQSVYGPLPNVKAFIQKSDRSMNIDWLLALKDENDKNRFDAVIFQQGHEYTYQEQN